MRRNIAQIQKGHKLQDDHRFIAQCYIEAARITEPSGMTIVASLVVASLGLSFPVSCCLLSIMANIIFMLQASLRALAMVIAETVPLKQFKDAYLVVTLRGST